VDADLTAREATDNAGMLTFAKAGSTLSVTHVTTEGKAATRTSTAFGGNSFNLALQIGNNHPTEALSGTVRVEVHEVEGPASVADPFDCDSRK
jgi:hypothetical protein